MLNFLYSFVFPYINFAIFIGVLIYFGKKPFGVFGKNKEDSYRAQCAEAQATYQKAQLRLKEASQNLSVLEQKLEEFKVDLIQEAKLEQKRVLDENQKTISRLQDESKRLCERYKSEVIAELRQKIWRLSQNEIVQKLNQDDQDKEGALVGQLKTWQVDKKKYPQEAREFS